MAHNEMLVAISAVWAIFLLVGCGAVMRWYTRGKLSLNYPQGWIILLALVVRLAPHLLLPTGAEYDINSYQMVGEAVLAGKDVYSLAELDARYPYLPFSMYWMAGALAMSEAMGVAYIKIVRLIPILGEVGIVWLLLNMGNKYPANQRQLAGLIYALNPISSLVSAYHGQFDALPAFAALAALKAIDEEHSIWAGAWLGLGILLKSWPVLALPLVLRLSGRAKIGQALLVSASIPLAAIGAYIYLFNGDLGQLIEQTLGYNHGVGVYGYSYLARLATTGFPEIKPWLAQLASLGRIFTLAILGMITWIALARKHATGGFLLIMVGFLATTHAFSIQYLLWVMPLAVLQADRWLARYILAAFTYMFVVYFGLILHMSVTQVLPWPQADLYLIMPFSLPVWAVAVGWLWNRLRQPEKQLAFALEPER